MKFDLCCATLTWLCDSLAPPVCAFAVVVVGVDDADVDVVIDVVVAVVVGAANFWQ